MTKCGVVKAACQLILAVSAFLYALSYRASVDQDRYRNIALAPCGSQMCELQYDALTGEFQWMPIPKVPSEMGVNL